MFQGSFADDAKTAYVSALLKTIVGLSEPTMDLCVAGSDSAVQLIPTATIAGSRGFQSNQFFDVTALFQAVRETRGHDNNRSPLVVEVVDGSLDESTGKIKLMPVRMYLGTISKQTPSSAEQPLAIASASGNQLRALLEDQQPNNDTVSLFCISGAKDEES